MAKKKAKSPVKSTVDPKKSESLVIDLETLMVPISILIAGLMISVSVLISFKGSDLGSSEGTTAGTTAEVAGTGDVDNSNGGIWDGEATVNIDDDPYLGDKKKAKIAIVEFSDYECPFCKRHYSETSGDLIKNFVDSGDAILVFRDFPLYFHDPLATEQAEAAECVQDLGGDEKYFAYHDLIFETTNSNGEGMSVDQLYDLAKDVGVDADAFASCYDGNKFADEVQDDIVDGSEAGIQGTPAFVIGKLDKNGEVDGVLLSGAYPYSDFDKAINQFLD